MDSAISLFLLQVALYSIFPLYLSTLKVPFRTTAFYVYSGMLFLLGGFLGSIFSLSIINDTIVSSGNIAYAAFMMTAIIFVIVERDLFIIRGIIKLVVTIIIFQLLLFYLLYFSLGSENIINVHAIDAEIFHVSVPLTLLGGILIVCELILILYIFENIKSTLTNLFLISSAYIFSFIAVLCLDGVIFPVVAFGTSQEFLSIIIGGVKGKFIIATAFSIPIAVYFYLCSDNLKLYTKTSPFSWQLLATTSEKLMLKMQEKEQKLQQASAVFDHTNEGVILTDEFFNVVNINNAFEKMLGLTSSYVRQKGPNIHSFVHFSKENFTDILATIKNTSFWKGEVAYKGELDNERTGLVTINPIKNEAGEVTNHVIVLTDITEIRKAQEQLIFLANHDPLTGLSNRRILFDQIERSLKTALRSNNKLALLIIDLDHFKDVNDSYGHQSGDVLLIEIAQTLTKRIRSADTLCRLGGDEFAVLINTLDDFNEAAHMADSIIESLSGPWCLSNGVQVHVGASIGISLYPDHGDTSGLLMQNADAALYKAKRIQRGTFEFFTQDMTNAAREKLELEMRLRKCVEDDRLEVFFQAQVEITSGEIVGAEALVRWNDPVVGYIQPENFIPLAESTGLIEKIGASVLKKTCLQGKAWIDAGNSPLRLSVNISPFQLRHGNIIEVLETILNETAFPPQFLELELTESALVEREGLILPLINALRERSIKIAIDDFGTGYSSLSYLRQFPIDTLKIDKSFIDDIDEKQGKKELVSTIIMMGHKLGFKVVAEGVETDYQLAFLKEKKCDYYQGYLLNEPVPAKEFIAFSKCFTTN